MCKACEQHKTASRKYGPPSRFFSIYALLMANSFNESGKNPRALAQGFILWLCCQLQIK